MTKKTFAKLLTYGISIALITAVLIISVMHFRFSIFSSEELVAIIAILVISVLIAAASSVFVSIKVTKDILAPIDELGRNLDNIEDFSTCSELQPLVNELQEQKRRQKILSNQKKQFTANISHELKTPLTSIAGFAELIETGIAKPEDIKPFAATIRKQALRLVTLSEDIIQLSQLEENGGENTISFSSVDIFEITSKCVEALSAAATLRSVTLSLSGESTFIKGNTALLEELIYNLCDNAIRYNKENGSVNIAIKRTDDGTMLTVADTGIGIDKKYQDRIFERFFRVDKSRSKETGGTGLGLAIVKHIVSLHDAVLNIDSKLGEGTQISILFQK